MKNFNQVSEILNGKLSFNFQSAGLVKEIELDSLPPETIAILLDYGTRKLNDKVNSLFAKDSNTESREALVERVWAEALEGKLGERRAPALGQKDFRDFILSLLRSQGIASKVLKPLNGTTPEVIVKTIWENEGAEYQAKVLAELKRRFDESKKLFEGFEVKK